MRKIIAAALTAAALSLTAVQLASPAGANTAHRPGLPVWMKTPCQSEDSVNCYWNARQMGNGEGLSFYVREMPGRNHTVCVFYVKRSGLDYCEATR